MYESLIPSDDVDVAAPGGSDPALRHEGDWMRPLRAHKKRVDRALASGELDSIKPGLMRLIANEQIMHAAILALVARGPKAPGLNGLRLEELNRWNRWDIARTLAKEVSMQTYQPGKDRVIHVPKEGKPGERRRITVQNGEDRVVSKATALVLEPLVDPGFSQFSFGWRPGRSALDALATMMALLHSQRSRFAVSVDVAKAFENIPHGRLLDACGHHFPPDIVKFLSSIATIRSRGIRQGSPLSPLLANIFFDYFLDRLWARDHPQSPLIRYSDDLLLLARDAQAAHELYEHLARRCRSSGTPVKESAPEAIVDLVGGQSLDWLGYLIRREENKLAIRISQKSWDRLDRRLDKAHLLDCPPIRAKQIVAGWLNHVGPCFAYEDRRNVLRRLRAAAAEHAFDEISNERRLEDFWGAAHARWRRRSSSSAVLIACSQFTAEGGVHG